MEEINKSIRQQLLDLGMREDELDFHESDLYVLKNEISEKWLETYRFKENVVPFVSSADEDGKTSIWYDVPFGYMPEDYASRGK